MVQAQPNGPHLPKCPTGIRGLDEITHGGLPRGRPTLVCGAAGSGKTLLGIEFLVHGTLQFGEPGVFISFEEPENELIDNAGSLGFGLGDLVARQLLAIDHVHIERSEIEETGEFDLEGLFVRLDDAVTSIGAQRVVLDTIEALFAGLPNEAILRAELRRLFRWLKHRGLTAIITGERGEGSSMTRHGIEEYVSDCVIFLDHRITDMVSTRRLRVVKYRGSMHGTNEYPFLIEQDGLSILPVTSLGLSHAASNERISTGIAALDAMLCGKGYYCGSTVLVSGTAGTGKTTLAASFADAACRRGERCLYVAYEESLAQVLRNMRSVGVDLDPWVQRGVLRYQAVRPTLQGLEMHLVSVHRAVSDFQPQVVIMDPITDFTAVGTTNEVRAMLTRLVDFLKTRGITALFTSLTSAGVAPEHSDANISSLIDTWILIRHLENNGSRQLSLCILKSRGMAHSNGARPFELSDSGIQIAPPLRSRKVER